MTEAQDKPGPGSIVCVPCGSEVNGAQEQVPGKLPNGDVCTHRTGKVGKHPTARRMIPRDTTPDPMRKVFPVSKVWAALQDLVDCLGNDALANDKFGPSPETVQAYRRAEAMLAERKS